MKKTLAAEANSRVLAAQATLHQEQRQLKPAVLERTAMVQMRMKMKKAGRMVWATPRNLLKSPKDTSRTASTTEMTSPVRICRRKMAMTMMVLEMMRQRRKRLVQLKKTLRAWRDTFPTKRRKLKAVALYPGTAGPARMMLMKPTKGTMKKIKAAKMRIEHMAQLEGAWHKGNDSMVPVQARGGLPQHVPCLAIKGAVSMGAAEHTALDGHSEFENLTKFLAFGLLRNSG
mmetsp:Transcript_15352/g.36522  ORF Transcript_15352/g.36522 Transcript_15352/m.36522 type:complete len:230 (-) Transcript_15352:295-984(-)